MCKMAPLGFKDADFPHRFEWRWSVDRGLHQRWVPYGMPRLNRAFERQVFFLYGTDPKTGKRIGPEGTGVIIGVPSEGEHWYVAHFYAVSCQHVAPRGASSIRINTKDGGSRFLDVHPDDWQWIQGHDDLAAADITDLLDRQNDDYSALPSSFLMTKEFIAENDVGIGEDGFMLGLFADLPGKSRNLVAARFGNVSLLADEDNPIKQPHHVRRPSHIFDIRSRPGFSGSPVFVYRTPAGDLRTASERGRWESMQRAYRQNMKLQYGNRYQDFSQDIAIAENTFLMLLGIHAGQYHDTVKFYKNEDSEGESDKIIRHGDMLRIPNSMAIVVPAWELKRLFDLPIFKTARVEREKVMEAKRRKENSAEPESAALPEHAEDHPASDENPNAREDFMRLQGAAARKQPQGD